MWLLAVTLTAGWQKIFSPDPRLGFLAHARRRRRRRSPPARIEPPEARALIFNDRLDAVVAVIFILVVLLVVVSSAWEWLQVLRSRKPAVARETPFVETAYAN